MHIGTALSMVPAFKEKGLGTMNPELVKMTADPISLSSMCVPSTSSVMLGRE
jgi:hypothetical protein